MKSVTLKIRGMHCNGCAQNIKAVVSSEAGVRGADVSFKDGQARILYDPQTVREDRLIELIKKAGYQVPAQEQ